MVGVGIEGAESSLARVSLVNYYGAVQLDEFVRQRERVVDYRTQWSGVRETDMIKGPLSQIVSLYPQHWLPMTAKPFVEVQKQVADLLKGRILVGHAVHNDLKVRAQTWRRTYLVAKDWPYRLYYSPIHVIKSKIPNIMQVNKNLSTPNTPLCATWWSTSSESRSKTGSILVYVQL